ncbi:MAG TPA: uroporphyrinogen decarboxylase family protein [bacterium]|nr:uroporphyrinogen decarboxylase family protein [bacterium]HQO34756.1 uroporphyrinogen decarboxylase family protein [bacterium]
MTSRKRLTGLLNRESIDRVPISSYEINPWDRENWYARQPSYARLCEHIRSHADCLWMVGAPGFNNAECPETVTEWRDGKSLYTKRIIRTPKGDLQTVTRVDDDLHTIWMVEHPFKSIEDVDRYLSVPWEFGGCDMSGIERAKREIGDNGILLCDISDPICTPPDLFEFGNFLVAVFEHRKKLRELMDFLQERILTELEYQLQHGAGPFWRMYGPEYATPPYLPPELFKELVVDYDRPIIDLIHRYGGKVRLHCHGRISEVLDYFVEMGADATDPIEPPPQGDIELAEVKRRVGDKMILFGSMELCWLEYCTPQQIDEHVRVMMESAKEGGGYAILPTAAPINIPLKPETERNYIQMIDSALKYGQYEWSGF